MMYCDRGYMCRGEVCGVVGVSTGQTFMVLPDREGSAQVTHGDKTEGANDIWTPKKAEEGPSRPYGIPWESLLSCHHFHLLSTNKQ